MNSFKQKCIELRRQDFTLPEIVKMTGRPKTSVYFHIQNLPLSTEKQQQIRKASAERIKAFPSARKGKSKRAFIKFSRWDKDTVFLVSHLLFDGEIRRGGCTYNNRSPSLIRNFESAVASIYEYTPRRHINKITGVRRTSYFNVALSAYLEEKSKLLIGEIAQLSPALKQEFLQAFVAH